jgi:hypothetical protein
MSSLVGSLVGSLAGSVRRPGSYKPVYLPIMPKPWQERLTESG